MRTSFAMAVLSLALCVSCIASDDERAAARQGARAAGSTAPAAAVAGASGEGTSEARWNPPAPRASGRGLWRDGELNWVPPTPAPQSLQAALDRSVYVVSGQLGEISEPVEVLAGPIGELLSPLYVRYQLSSAVLQPDGSVDRALTALLSGNSELNPALQAGAIEIFTWVYGPYDTATEAGDKHEYALSGAFVDALPLQPAAFQSGARVVLFVELRSLVGLDPVYDVVQAVPLVEDKLDARSLEDARFVPLEEFVADLEATFAARESALTP